jgi:hypothetical protein
MSREGVYISSRGLVRRGYYWEGCGIIWIKLCMGCWVKEGLQGLRAYLVISINGEGWARSGLNPRMKCRVREVFIIN